MVRIIEVVPYRCEWPQLFETEARALRALWGQEVVAIHHIGSTAIPGIQAKPIIDLVVEVKDLSAIDAYDEQMRAGGYLPLGEYGIPGRRFFIKGTTDHRSHHIHGYATGHPDIPRHLNFRDYLRAHPQEAAAYSDLKESLVARFPTDIEAYMEGKHDLIQTLQRNAEAWCRDRNASQ